MSTTSSDRFPETDRTTIGRSPDRGTRDRATANAILDEGVLCHVGIATDHGPVVIPTTYARRGDDLLIHGSPAATWLRSAGKGTPVCVTVTHVDGLVLARSAFHHSMNYRSVVVFGTAVPIKGDDEKAAALDAIVEQLVPGRTAEVRPMHDEEVTKTLVVKVPLQEASVKTRSGGPLDDEEDYDLPDVWAGVIPMTTHFGTPIDDERLTPGIGVPPSAADYRR
ncbi:pyridoxamine 5'-phosphate oxidase family protein [Actinospongicola halichondriae]|uniref:pyridoxamine 5'-phosphate oxidase family protein n=1 Tax=Actinospongicola halichondriae TaxID=3236844 RepID=UPI003D45A4E1